MFSSEPRCRYQKNQLVEVICQLRFPEILTIQTTLPAEFQEEIRRDFPDYSSRKEQHAPKLMGLPGHMSVENGTPMVNHQFTTEDGTYRVNLTSRFFSLVCANYTCWEDFARMLDKPLAAFIKIYQPAYFERIGLRYVNAFSRKELALEDVSFRELIADRYLGIFADDELAEQSLTRSTVDGDIAIRGGCRAKIHAGPGMVKRGNVQDTEVKFIFDQDLFMPGKIPVNLSTAALFTLHAQGWAIFRDAITTKLHEAMEP